MPTPSPQQRRVRGGLLCIALALIACTSPSTSTRNSRAKDQIARTPEREACSRPASASPTQSTEASGIPDGYVAVAGGWAHPDCIHIIPSGAVVESDGLTVSQDGAILSTYTTCPHPFVRDSHLQAPSDRQSPIGLDAGIDSPDAAASQSVATQAARTIRPEGAVGSCWTGWVEYTEQTTSAAYGFTQVDEVFVVPTVPPATPYVTERYWGALAAFNGPDLTAFWQPSVGFGPTALGGSFPNYGLAVFWVVTPYGGGNVIVYGSNTTTVNPGDLVAFQFNTTAQNTLKVTAVDQTTGGLQSFSASYAQAFSTVYPAGFEVQTNLPPSSNYICNCNQVPYALFATFGGISLYQSPTSWNNEVYVPYNPSTSSVAVTSGLSVSNCNWSVGSGWENLGGGNPASLGYATYLGLP